MSENRSQILKHCIKWHFLGVETRICKVEKVMGIRKFHKDSIKFSMKIGINPEIIPEGYNFLGVCLGDSGIMCLDIEGTPGSLDDFYRILEEKSLKISDFFVESTMNGGIHIYFRIPDGIKKRNLYARTHKRIDFDVLFRGKSFSVPSRYGDKSYSFINKSLYDLNSIMDIPEFPQELYFLIQKGDK